MSPVSSCRTCLSTRGDGLLCEVQIGRTQIKYSIFWQEIKVIRCCLIEAKIQALTKLALVEDSALNIALLW